MSLLPLRRSLLNRTTHLVPFARHIGIPLNPAFYCQAFPLPLVNSLYNWLVLLSIPITAINVVGITTTLASFLKLDRVVISLLILLSASTQYFIWNFRVVIDRSMVTNTLNTTPAESFVLLSGEVIAVLGLPGVLAVFVAWWVRIREPATRWRGTAIRLLNIAALALLTIPAVALFYKDYVSVFRNNKGLIKSLSPSSSTVVLNSWYVHSHVGNLPLVKIGKDARQKPVMHNGPCKNLAIVVLSETLRAGSFSLGGYDRKTNPHLQQDDVVYFPETISCGMAAAIPIPCMFSNMPRAHYNGELAHRQKGVLGILQHVDVQVLWNDNDGGYKGTYGHIPHQDVAKLHFSGQCIDGECYDEIPLHSLNSYIDNLKQDGIIVPHTIGSHGPTYYNHYLVEFRKFTPTCDTNEIQSCTQQQLTNTYDNTVLYVNYVVDKAIKLL